MKKLLIPIIAIAALSGCTKNNFAIPSEVQFIVGKWDWQKTYNMLGETNPEILKKNKQIEFSSKGKCIQYTDGKITEKSNYRIRTENIENTVMYTIEYGDETKFAQRIHFINDTLQLHDNITDASVYYYTKD